MPIALRSLFALVVLFFSSLVYAWWDEAWTQRTSITINTTANGVELKSPLTNFPLAVRLHSGNFDFLAAKEDGSDLRVVAGDDKTPLKFQIERFDATNELAVLWVQVPLLAAGSDANKVFIYFGNEAAAGEPANAGGFDANHLAVFHFNGAASDAPADAINSSLKAAAPVAVEVNGLVGQSASFAGQPMLIAANERLSLPADGSLTVSAWVRPADVAKGSFFEQGALNLGVSGGKLALSLGTAQVSGGELKAAEWQHVALTVGAGKAVIYLNGMAVGETTASLPALSGEVRVGNGYTGLLDALHVSNVVRSAEFLRTASAMLSSEGKLAALIKEAQGEEAGEEGGHNYFGVLVDNLTADAWAVIIILGIMFAIACWVMVAKQIFISKAEKANRAFLQRFRKVNDNELLQIADAGVLNNSSLFKLYQVGVAEINKRFAARASVGAAAAHVLSGASIDAVKASIDADLVRENHKLNNMMVLLTIAISGGPFLGLLGTVVGVMITFAAIAAAGDVNVNAIAPGIAAALLATVAGLAVAIPALFGYNWLAAKIKNISSDMQIFVDEFVTRVAEKYGD